MFLRKAELNDIEWIYETLAELSGDVKYSLNSFVEYFKCLNNEICTIMIFCDDKNKIGLVTLNKFCIPRYLGVGYEMEEFMIHKDFRGQGYSYKMIEAVKVFVGSDPQVRKLIIKSNGEDSKHIYAKALKQTDLINFQIYLNKL